MEMQMTSESTEILTAGAGPTGLLLAGDLAAAAGAGRQTACSTPTTRSATRSAGSVAARTRPHPRLILVRPDGYVAWATDQADTARRDVELHQALTRWCGTPAPASVT
jgi:hypothetical protein